MTDWTAFAGFSGVVVLLLLLLARASQTLLTEAADRGTVLEERDHYGDSPDQPDGSRSSDDGIPRSGEGTGDETVPTDGAAGSATGETASPESGTAPESRAGPASTERAAATSPDPTAGRATNADSAPDARARPEPTRTGDGAEGRGQTFGTGELLANVLVTHGLFAALVAGAAVYWEVPASALGIAAPTLPVLGWGLVAGVALYVANEVGAVAADRLGVGHSESLRELLAPASPAGWALLLGGALPMVAVGEELIFRGVLVGALHAGFGLPIWGLAVASSAAFALGHGAQGTGGIVVTGLLGFALAAAYVVSGSLLLVIVAHYVVNALEFVVHEGLGVEWVE